MSFMISCPYCGNRPVTEFRFGGETRPRPEPHVLDKRAWGKYLYDRVNTAGVQKEWWFHRAGCKKWFIANRHNSSNRFLSSAPAKIAMEEAAE